MGAKGFVDVRNRFEIKSSHSQTLCFEWCRGSILCDVWKWHGIKFYSLSGGHCTAGRCMHLPGIDRFYLSVLSFLVAWGDGRRITVKSSRIRTYLHAIRILQLHRLGRSVQRCQRSHGAGTHHHHFLPGSRSGHGAHTLDEDRIERLRSQHEKRPFPRMTRLDSVT